MTIGMRLMMFSFVCGGSANSKFSMSDAAMACISMRAKRQPAKKAHIEYSSHDTDRPSEYLTYATTDTSSYSHASAQDHVSRVDGHTEGEQVRVKADRRHLRLVEVCKAIRVPFVGIRAPYLRVTNDALAYIYIVSLFKRWSGIPIV